MTGPAPKPTVIRLAEGVPGHHRPIYKNEPKPLRRKPTMPAHLVDPVAIKTWRKYVPILFRLGLLTESDGEALAAYCQAVASLAAASQAVQEEGRMKLTAPKVFIDYKSGEKIEGAEVVKPATIQLFKALALVNVLGQQFGLTPASRSRMEVQPPDPDAPGGGIR